MLLKREGKVHDVKGYKVQAGVSFINYDPSVYLTPALVWSHFPPKEFEWKNAKRPGQTYLCLHWLKFNLSLRVVYWRADQ